MNRTHLNLIAMTLLFVSLGSRADVTHVYFEGVVTEGTNNIFSNAVPLPYKDGDPISGRLTIDHGLVDTFTPKVVSNSFGTQYYNTPYNNNTKVSYLPIDNIGDQRFITGYFDDQVMHHGSNDWLQLADGASQDNFVIQNGYNNGHTDSMRAGSHAYIKLGFVASSFLNGIGLTQEAFLDVNSEGFNGSGSLRVHDQYQAPMYRYRKDINPEGSGTVEFDLTMVRIETVSNESTGIGEYCPIP